MIKLVRTLMFALITMSLALAACAPATTAAPEPTDAPPATEAQPTEAVAPPATEAPAEDPLAMFAPDAVSGDIIAAGSSTVFPLSERMKQRFEEEGFTGNLTVDSIGSGAGIERFCVAGETDIANSSRAIRDTEIEDTVHRIADPIFDTAGLDRESIDIYLLNDPTLNAFVSGGQNLFVNTGLIMRTANPDELRGVIAHETGHIAGGHLSRTAQARDQAMAKTLLGAVLGLAGVIVLFAGRGTLDFAAGAMPGYAAALAAAFVWSGYSVLSARVGTVPTDAVAGFCLVTAALSLACHLAVETTLWPADAAQWGAVAALGVGPIGAAFYLWDIGMKRGDIRFLGVAAYAAPVLSTLLLVATGYATATPALALACALIVAGALVAVRASRRTPHRAAS